jgi:hypothetical protein
MTPFSRYLTPMTHIRDVQLAALDRSKSCVRQFLLCAVLLAAMTARAAAEMPAACQDSGARPSERAECVDRLFTLAERAWVFGAAYYVPT